MKKGFLLIELFSKCDTYLFRVPRADDSLIESYICTEKNKEISPKPMLVLLQGSGSNSVFVKKNRGFTVTFMFSTLINFIKQWNIVLVEKRGIKLNDNFSSPEDAGKEYIEHCTRSQRINDVSYVIEHLISHGLYDGSKILVVGHSEGTHVAVGVSLINKYISHAGLFGCSAGHGLYDCLLNLRKDLKLKKISEGEFHERYNRYIADFTEISYNIDSTELQYWGHPYRRWSSFWNRIWLEEFLKLEIPVYIGIASDDRNSPPEGSDWLISEYIKNGKRNLT